MRLYPYYAFGNCSVQDRRKIITLSKSWKTWDYYLPNRVKDIGKCVAWQQPIHGNPKRIGAYVTHKYSLTQLRPAITSTYVRQQYFLSRKYYKSYTEVILVSLELIHRRPSIELPNSYQGV